MAFGPNGLNAGGGVKNGDWCVGGCASDILCPCRFCCIRGGTWIGDEVALNGGCGEVVIELAREAACDCCNLLSLKYNRAESAGDDIWVAKSR
jgi:hypothetical protein